MQAVPLVFSKHPEILLVGGYRLNKIPRSVRIIWIAEKQNEQTTLKIGKS